MLRVCLWCPTRERRDSLEEKKKAGLFDAPGEVSRSIKLLWCGVLCEMRIDASGGESVLYRRDHGQGNGRPRVRIGGSPR